MGEKDLRNALLNGKKSKRIIFAVTPELKKAVAILANERCTKVSSLLTSLARDALVNSSLDFIDDLARSFVRD